jgi:protein-L-isoaspartate(D-aspartate) O-methyltransferase
MTVIDTERARFNMVEQQVRPCNVFDPKVLETISQIPREAFVPAPYQGLAFADIEIPLADGERMLSPPMIGQILQALQINKNDRVLEVGSGSGYLTACLANLSDRVTTIESNKELAELAADNLERQQIRKVERLYDDFFESDLPIRGFDVIVFTGSMPELPEQAIKLLDDNGRLFAVLGDEPAMQATLLIRKSDGSEERKTLFETVLPPLHQPETRARFEF